MVQPYEANMLNPAVYIQQKGFGAPVFSGLSKDRSKLIIRVATQESLLPDDIDTRKVELFVVAKSCALYYEAYFPFAGNAKHTRVEFMREGADTVAREKNTADEQTRNGIPIAVYENGELTMS